MGIVVKETDGQLEPIHGNPIIDSLDGSRRAPLLTIMHSSWSAEDRAEFGIYEAIPFSRTEDENIVDGPTYVKRANNKVYQIYTTETIPLDTFKTEYQKMLDSAAERERLKYITPGSGQAMTYQKKYEQATKYINDPNPDANNYLLLAASVGVDGENLDQVAQVVLNLSALWEMVAASIETVRLGAKSQVAVANTLSEIKNIYENIEWP